MDNLKTKRGWKYKVDKLLFIFASLYLITIVTWLWKQKQQSQTLSNTTKIRENQTIVNNNQSLKNELIKTSELNNQKLNNGKQLTLIPSIPLPVVEEISNKTTFDSILSVPLPPPPSINLQQNPQAISPPSPPAPIISTPKTLTKVPTIRTLSEATAEKVAINNIPLPSPEATPTNIINTESNHSLIGIVQLPNNKSFALFNINEITEKVSVGTEIGTSGWVLMAVNGKQVTVSRQNKSINIRVGETF